MTKLVWNEDILISLGRIFLRKVRDNMRGHLSSVVRFGQTGQGIAPNYQVTLPNGVILTYRGLSHKRFEEAAEFDISNISEPFDLAAITRAYEAT